MSRKLSFKSSTRQILGIILLAFLFLPTANAGSFSCNFTISTQWGTGASAALTITNTHSQAVEWQAVTLAFPEDSSVQVTSFWNAAASGSDPVAFTPLSWNRLLQPGQSANIGMQLAKSSAGQFPAAVLGGDCVAGVNQAPVAAIAISSVESLVTLDASGSHDPDGDSLTYEWTVDGQAFDSGMVLTDRYFAKGTYVISVTVSDGELSDTATETFHQDYPPAHSPQARFTYNVNELVVAFNGTISKANGPADNYIQSYYWDFGDGATGSGPTLNHTYLEPGVYHVTLTVYDAYSQSAARTESITVTGLVNTPPVAVIALPDELTPVMSVRSASYDLDGDLLSYHWVLNGTSIGYFSSVVFWGFGYGTHILSLTVSDGELSDKTTLMFTISEPGDVVCTYEVTGGWGNNFEARVKIVNNGTVPISNWSVAWDYRDGSTLTGWWDADITGSGEYTAVGKSWNRHIAAGGSVQFGIQGIKGSAEPTIPELGGITCTQ